MAAMKKLILVLLVSLYAIAPLAQATDVRYCTKKLYEVKVSKIDIDPYPVVRGKPTTFSISANTDTPISGGKLEIDVSIFGIHIHSENHDLCNETSCPVSVGDFVVSHSQSLPAYTPPGSYTLRMRLYDGNSHELTCITFDFKIGLGSSAADS
ncbi:MD-2-related lipid-recognition domain containing protein [Parasponia andersonii]|uniref:MD-2-related lipid-recognition domain containing protein n=1 Tax=Parasponia andersonii TaxID=3476 RepID=A0A2P5AZX0_PARAD|nr:MD-2-related lipid-recognition domain containing protein [Parasponia andersonii]